MKLQRIITTVTSLLLCLLLIVGCTPFTNSSPPIANGGNLLSTSTSQNIIEEPVDTWQLGYYVDEFEMPTNDKYISNCDYFQGTFSNSATTDSLLFAQIVIDQEKIVIYLLEYGSRYVKASSTTNYNIVVLDENGTKHQIPGIMLEGTNFLYVGDWPQFDLVPNWDLLRLLQKNSRLKVYIQEDSEYGINSTYLFTVMQGNFNSVYNDYN